MGLGHFRQCEMGWRKFKLGRAHKNYERKRQQESGKSIGRPPKKNKGKSKVRIATKLFNTSYGDAA